jgi:DNA-binding GntR family transcriptional regulator
MASVAMSLRATAEVYRRWSMPFEIVPRDVPAEHQELVDLALARDAEGGEAALRRHLELTRDLILDGSRRPSQ